MKIGFIGAGRMGHRMVRNLIAGGHSVDVFDKLPQTLEAVPSWGATPVASIAALAAGKEVVFTMLPVPAASIDVYCGEDGLLQHAKPETLLAECSTVDIDTVDKIDQAARARGLSFADAPLTGGVQGAEAGTLTFMVGGSSAQFDTLMPALQSMGKKFVHVGAVGSGTRIKLVNNMINATNLVVAAEGLALGQKLGLDPKKMYEVISSGTGASWVFSNYFPLPGVLPNVPSNRNFQNATFPASLMIKDTQCALHAAQRVGSPVPINALAAAFIQLYCMHFDGDLDWSAVSMLFQNSAPQGIAPPAA